MPAHCAFNTGTVNQTEGWGNSAIQGQGETYQFGWLLGKSYNGEASITQVEGDGNLAVQYQVGDGNIADTYQEGSLNTAVSYQLGETNESFITQVGEQNQAYNDFFDGPGQVGSYNEYTIDQNGVGNLAWNNQYGDWNTNRQHQNGEYNYAGTAQHGISHFARIHQVGNNNGAEIRQYDYDHSGVVYTWGSNNQVQIMQAGPNKNRGLVAQGRIRDPEEPRSEWGWDEAPTANNTAWLFQVGEYNFSYQQQLGEGSHFSVVDQFGTNNISNTFQNGFGNSSTVIQYGNFNNSLVLQEN